MYKLILICFMLSGCGWGYEVRSHNRGSECVQKSPPIMSYSCVYVKPVFFKDITEKVCNTLEECNKYCEHMRSL